MDKKNKGVILINAAIVIGAIILLTIIGWVIAGAWYGGYLKYVIAGSIAIVAIIIYAVIALTNT